MGNLTDYAERELRAAGLFDEDSDYGGMLAEGVMKLVVEFSAQGHSGFSANQTINIFERVARFEPLGPLTGEDDEWNEIGDGVYQNRRCSHVFKEHGEAYDINGRIFREKGGATYTSKDSRVAVTFPYTPKSEVVDEKP